MSDRTTVSPETAFPSFLSSTLRDLTAIEQREEWPAAVKTLTEAPNAASPYSVHVGSPPSPLLTDEVASVTVPQGRWVILFRSIMDGTATWAGATTRHTMYSRFMRDSTELTTQLGDVLTFTGSTSTIMAVSHGYAYTAVLTADTTFSIRVAASKTLVGGGLTWFLRTFSIIAVPG